MEDFEDFVVAKQWFNEFRYSDKAKVHSHFAKNELLTRGYLRRYDKYINNTYLYQFMVAVIKVLIAIQTGINIYYIYMFKIKMRMLVWFGFDYIIKVYQFLMHLMIVFIHKVIHFGFGYIITLIVH